MTESRKIYSFWQRWLTGWLPFIAVTAVIIKGAVMPPSEVPGFLIKVNDKLIHGTEFFVMMLIAYRAFERAASEVLYRRRWIEAILYSVFLGAFTEFLQLFCPGRSADIFDFLADSAGVLVAAAGTVLSNFYCAHIKREVRK